MLTLWQIIHPSIHISIFRLGCYLCPILDLWGLQHHAMSNTGSPCIPVLWVNASQATVTDINLHTITRPQLALGELNEFFLIFKLILLSDGWGISYEIGLRWLSLDFTDDKWTLVQKMVRCHEASCHYQGVQFMRTRDGGRKLIGVAEMVPLNPFH